MISQKILETFDVQTAEMLPQKEEEWWEGRKRIEEYEMEYRRAVFQVENRKCLSLQALMGGTLPVEAGIAKSEVLLFIHRMTDEAYRALIEQYVSEAAALAPEALAEEIRLSQEAWLAYRERMETVWIAIGARIEQAQWLVNTAQERLEALFLVYRNLKSG